LPKSHINFQEYVMGVFNCSCKFFQEAFSLGSRYNLKCASDDLKSTQTQPVSARTWYVPQES
jgi:hypothetical protein